MRRAPAKRANDAGIAEIRDKRMLIHVEGGKGEKDRSSLDGYVGPFRPQFKRVKLSDREFAPRECSPFIAVQPSELTRHTHQNLDPLDILFNCRE